LIEEDSSFYLFTRKL